MDSGASVMPTMSAGELPYNSLQARTVVAFSISYFIATIFLGLRWFQTVKFVKWVECDVVITTFSYGISMAYFLTTVKLMHHGWARHVGELSQEDFVEINKHLLANTILYILCPAITKLGMLTVFFRIIPSFICRCFIVGIAVSIISYTVVLTSITGGPCNPLKSGAQQCLQDVALAQAILNIVSDLALVVVPIPMIHSLGLSLKQRIQIGCLLALGSGVVICSIARLPYVIRVETATDVTYEEGVLGIWSIVEVNLGIICSSAMRMKRLIVAYLPKLRLGWSNEQPRASETPFEVSDEGVIKTTETDVEKNHGYHLHSIQKNSAPPMMDPRPIEYSYHVSCEADGKSSSEGSTDKIMS